MSWRPEFNMGSSFTIMLGWLFADMLLVLTILFMASTTFRETKVEATLTPTPAPVSTPTLAPTPTPTVNALILDSQKERLVINGNDPNQLSQNKPDAVRYLQGKIREQINKMQFQNRRAGIEIVYGGVNDFTPNERGRAVTVATKVYGVLDALGQSGFVFCHSVHYDPPLFTADFQNDTVVIDIYFFNASIKGC